jgi:hypothetical protein
MAEGDRGARSTYASCGQGVVTKTFSQAQLDVMLSNIQQHSKTSTNIGHAAINSYSYRDIRDGGRRGLPAKTV